ncbi:DUF2007 domain-containing protein [Haloferula rosea]|uniref:DUF2007 domain-containing protein n=2 Tax=Haloferula rosea TaxID=490093 RepID=A0A934RAV4_9BACT|nr:DUF2007 domain-containing protein [Haloferula rosea]
MVGHFQSILESEGIRTEVRNEGGSSLAGEVPFTQVFPELWVIEPEDTERAKQLIETYLAEDSRSSATLKPWTCPNCAETVTAELAECWNCGTPFPTP